MLRWLVQGGPNALKHRGKHHPIVTFVCHYSIVALVTISTHDWLLARDNTACVSNAKQQTVGVFFGIYFLLFFACRLALRWHHQDFFVEFYKQTFLCSVTIFHAALGLYTGRSLLAQSFCVAVGIDQILWYVDLGGYLIRCVRVDIQAILHLSFE